nr:glycoprotein vIgFam9 [Elephant endotheliotropic herpesvirus 1A]
MPLIDSMGGGFPYTSYLLQSYILLMCFYALSGGNSILTATVGETVILGPSDISFDENGDEVRWFYNESKLIMYSNKTSVIRDGKYKPDSRRYKLNIERLEVCDFGNYTLHINNTHNNRNQTYLFMLIINAAYHSTAAPAGGLLSYVSSSDSLQYCNYYVHFVILIAQYYVFT